VGGVERGSAGEGGLPCRGGGRGHEGAPCLLVCNLPRPSLHTHPPISASYMCSGGEDAEVAEGGASLRGDRQRKAGVRQEVLRHMGMKTREEKRRDSKHGKKGRAKALAEEEEGGATAAVPSSDDGGRAEGMVEEEEKEQAQVKQGVPAATSEQGTAAACGAGARANSDRAKPLPGRIRKKMAAQRGAG
jgi:hypothetical protein